MMKASTWSPASPGVQMTRNSGTAQQTGRLYDIKDIPGRGKGLVACVDIPTGTRVLSEKPLFTVMSPSLQEVPQLVATKLKALPKEKQHEFLTLHNNFVGRKHPFAGIFATNALPCGPDSPEGGIYATACRINHSCRPNTHNSWHSELGVENIHAIRPIEAGEEITISYAELLMPSAERRAMLKKAFGFHCTCSGCDLPPAALKASDERRLELKRLDAAIGDPFRASIHRLQDCHSFLAVVRQELGPENALIACTYNDAFQFCIGSGDEARASVCAAMAQAGDVVCLGEDAPETKRHGVMAMNPRADPQYGVVDRKWKGSKEMIPKGIGEEAMEKWLFRL